MKRSNIEIKRQDKKPKLEENQSTTNTSRNFSNNSGGHYRTIDTTVITTPPTIPSPSSSDTTVDNSLVVQPNRMDKPYNGIKVRLFTRKNQSDSWTKAKHTCLIDQPQLKVPIACHISDFDRESHCLDSKVQLGVKIYNPSREDIAAELTVDEQYVAKYRVKSRSKEMFTNVGTGSLHYQLFVKQHAAAQDESEIDSSFLSVMGTIKVRILKLEELIEIQDSSIRQAKVEPIQNRFTCVKVGSMKGSTMSVEFGSPQVRSCSNLFAVTNPQPIKYRNNIGYLLLLVQANKYKPQRRTRSSQAEVIEISDE